MNTNVPQQASLSLPSGHVIHLLICFISYSSAFGVGNPPPHLVLILRATSPHRRDSPALSASSFITERLNFTQSSSVAVIAFIVLIQLWIAWTRLPTSLLRIMTAAVVCGFLRVPSSYSVFRCYWLTWTIWACRCSSQKHLMWYYASILGSYSHLTIIHPLSWAPFGRIDLMPTWKHMADEGVEAPRIERLSRFLSVYRWFFLCIRE